MTKNEAKEEIKRIYFNDFDVLQKYYEVIDKVCKKLEESLIKEKYEELENMSKMYNKLKIKTCESCKYYEAYPSICCNTDSPICTIIISKDFYCNKWKE
jgi:hypothetical protein